jgi:hypothetical protein
MASIKCQVNLLSNKGRKVDVELIKEKSDKLLWKVIKSSGGNLRLYENEGYWEISSGEILSLWYETKGQERKRNPNIKTLVTLVAFNIKQDFFDDIVNNGATIETEFASLYNDNPSEKEVLCKLGRMN